MYRPDPVADGPFWLRCFTAAELETQQMVEETITLAAQVRSAQLANCPRVLLRAMPPADRCDEHSRDLPPRRGRRAYRDDLS